MIVTGSTPPKAKPEWFGDSIPFITPSDLMDGVRSPSPARGLSSDGAAAFSKRLLPAGSVCFVCIASIGKLCLTDTASATNQQINSIVPGDATDGRFLYYLLRHEASRIAGTASGAATPIINKSAFGATTVRVPEFAYQQKIGEALCRFDDLIENNRRRVEVLEEMARAIYREWFVHFRYPGHESVPLVDSPLGPIPEGWSVRRLGDLAELVRTNVQPKRSPEEIFNHFSIPAFDQAKLPSAEEGSTIRSGKYLLNSPAVMVSKLNPRIERTWFARPTGDHRSIASTEFLILQAIGHVSLQFLYATARSAPFQERLRELSGGTSTSHQRARPGDFLELEVLDPGPEPIARFSDATTASLDLAHDLVFANRHLVSLRDLLLPKLVTGRIDVSSLDLDSLVEGSVG